MFRVPQPGQKLAAVFPIVNGTLSDHRWLQCLQRMMYFLATGVVTPVTGSQSIELLRSAPS